MSDQTSFDAVLIANLYDIIDEHGRIADSRKMIIERQEREIADLKGEIESLEEIMADMKYCYEYTN